MINVLLLILGLVAVGWFQTRYLAPLKSKKEWTVYLCTMLLVAFVGTNLVLSWSLTSPMWLLRSFIEPIGKTILH
ncbi:hypothetical protein [Alicyclobacillus acidiphilus]|uniref:hypothetical protein n=1 Tax=Alicyclobacillus acidiphilus TaxID=182455 RepID=UPI000832CDEA|nr:hypothetical protein [Alicyclobacillus acidiphilus]